MPMPMFAVGTARRLRAVRSGDGVVDSAVGTAAAFGSSAVSADAAFDTAVAAGAADCCGVASGVAVGGAVVSGAVVSLASGAARGLGRSPRDFPAPAVLAVVEADSVSAALADASAAGEILARTEGRLEVRAEAGPAALPVVEPVADACVELEEPSSAQAIPQVVKIAAPTPSATASPPTRPIHIEALIVPATGSRKVLQGRSCAEPPLYTIFRCVAQHISWRYPLIGLFGNSGGVRVCGFRDQRP